MVFSIRLCLRKCNGSEVLFHDLIQPRLQHYFDNHANCTWSKQCEGTYIKDATVKMKIEVNFLIFYLY